MRRLDYPRGHVRADQQNLAPVVWKRLSFAGRGRPEKKEASLACRYSREIGNGSSRVLVRPIWASLYGLPRIGHQSGRRSSALGSQRLLVSAFRAFSSRLGSPYSPSAMPQRIREAFHAAEVIEPDLGFRPWQIRCGGLSTSTAGSRRRSSASFGGTAPYTHLHGRRAGALGWEQGERKAIQPGRLAIVRELQRREPLIPAGSMSLRQSMAIASSSAPRRATMSWPRHPKRRLTRRLLMPRLRPR